MNILKYDGLAINITLFVIDYLLILFLYIFIFFTRLILIYIFYYVF